MGKFKEVFKRMEIKYLIEESQYKDLMVYLETIAQIDQYGLSKINNIYFDTPDYRLIRTSMEKPIYKEKLRLRTYGHTTSESNSFIEIKKKYDKVVYKRRIAEKYSDAYAYLTGNCTNIKDTQVSHEIEYFINTYEELRPTMKICYDRIAMVGINDSDFRVTFDKNIRWSTTNLDLRKESKGREVIAPNQYLMEIKVSRAFPLELSRKLSELGIFPASFSKYGRAYMDMIKQISSQTEVIDYAEYKNKIKGKRAE